MSEHDSLVVYTCAGSGRQASYILPRLYHKYHLRLVVKSEASAQRLKDTYPNAEIIQADITELSNCIDILKGATNVFHVGPSLHPRETEIGINMIDDAIMESTRPGNHFKHFIYSSVLNTQLRKMFNHDRKRYVEEYLYETNLNYTVLSPGDFLNMGFPIKLLASTEKPEYISIMGLESRSAFVVLEDYAEACEKIIDEGDKHYGAQYQMCSTKSIEYGVVAAAYGRTDQSHNRQGCFNQR